MKKIIVIIELLLLFMLSVTTCFSQKLIRYNYVVNNRTSNDKPYLGMELEFSTARKFYDNAKFKESRLFTGSNNDYIHYCIKNQTWYYKDKNKWRLFVDFENKQGGEINLLGNDYKIVCEKEILIRDKKLYKVNLRPINVTIINQPTYFFDPKEGVVIFRSASGIVLIRKDYIFDHLTENEINLL
jgi:hypothetical protein